MRLNLDHAMRFFLPVVAVTLLVACQPPVPNDTLGGIGFESYASYQKRRAAMAAQPILPGPGPINQLPVAALPPGSVPAPQGSVPISSAPLTAVSPQTGDLPPAAPLSQPAASVPAEPDPLSVATTGISDEQDFSAVAARETIESDKQRIDQNKAQFQQIAPKDLPQRSGKSSGPDIIAYAISAPNRLGEPIYKRSRNVLRSNQRSCARFNTPEDAQAAFLKSGGPKRDPRNLDPDGDGFACFWDPTPFQKVR